MEPGLGGEAMKRAFVFAMAVAGSGIVAASIAAFALRPPPSVALAPAALSPAFTEIKWPFPIDQWGTGRAFACLPADCGARVEVYIRPKIGFCNCSTGVADDTELERVADTSLVDGDLTPLGPGHPIKVGWMKGLARLYEAADGKAGGRLVSIAFNDECDVVVAVAKLGGGDSTALSSAILAFLNSRDMVLWAKKEIGLEFVKREW
jgi:hypothetical protein